MELRKEFQELLCKLVNQKQDELSREQSQSRDKILDDMSRRGWINPPGYVYEELSDLQVESIRRRSDIVWSAFEQTLEAFDPPFYPELANQLYSFAENFFLLTLSEPQDFLSKMGWNHPSANEVNQQLQNQLELARNSALDTVKTKIDLYVAKKQSKYMGGEPSPLESGLQKKWDLFICHASEDKIDFVSPLAMALKQKGINVWYDDFCIKWGDSIRRSIENGLKSCKFGIIVFSHAFFCKEWPQNELDALYQRMISGETRILPIWHGIGEEDLRAYSPLLSGFSAKKSNIGIEALCTEIEARLQEVT